MVVMDLLWMLLKFGDKNTKENFVFSFLPKILIRINKVFFVVFIMFNVSLVKYSSLKKLFFLLVLLIILCSRYQYHSKKKQKNESRIFLLMVSLFP